jgi:hypothetical protein
MGIPLTLLIYCIGPGKANPSNANRQAVRENIAHKASRAKQRRRFGSKRQLIVPSGRSDGTTCAAQL